LESKKSLFILLIVSLISLQLCHLSCDALYLNQSPLNQTKDWFILLDYSEESKVQPSDIESFDMAILDPDAHPSLTTLKGKVFLIAYISLGEAENYRFYWDKIKDRSWVIGENPNWEGNYLVDIREKEWQELILNEVIPRIIEDGFQGVMMDTLDTAETLESDDGGDFKGSYEAMVHLVKTIHEKYPDLMLISNNGFSILKEIAPYLSGMLVEDIFGMPDFEANDYIRVPPEIRRQKVEILKPLQEQYQMPVFNIEYVAMRNKALARQYAEASHELGFVSYVAEKELSKIYRVE